MNRDRRAFLESLAVVPLVPAALGSQAALAPAPAATPVGQEAVANAHAEAVRRQFGAHLDESEIQAVKKQLLRNLERAERLRKAVRLQNADEPVARFEPVPPVSRGERR